MGFADACGNAVDTTLRVLQNEAGHGDDPPQPSDMWHYNLSAHYLADFGCKKPNPITYRLLEDNQTAVSGYLYAIDELVLKLPWVANCTQPNMTAHVQQLGQAINTMLSPLGGAAACGDDTIVSKIFAHGATDGLCVDAGVGFVLLWFWQLMSGAVLVFLSLLLPGLWHSHVLPALPLPPASWAELDALVCLPARGCWRSSCARVAAAWARCCTCRDALRALARLAKPNRYNRHDERDGHSLQEGDDDDGALATAAEGLRAPMLFPSRSSSGAPAASDAISPPLAEAALSRIGSRCPSPSLAPLPSPGAAPDSGVEPLLLPPREREGTWCSSHEAL